MSSNQNSTFPAIHLNGTGAETLLEGYVAAYLAVGDAIDTLRKVEFNARDYYVQGENAWGNALKNREELFRKLDAVKSELEAHAEHIQTQIEIRNSIRA